MHEDYDQVPGWPAKATGTHRELNQFQKGALLRKICRERWIPRAKRLSEPSHPKCSFCRCEHCREVA